MERRQDLMERYAPITNSKKARPISESHKASFERIMGVWEDQYLKETTFSGDLARLGQVLIPVYRRAFAALITKDIVGVQPLSQPNGVVFAMRYFYDGTKGQRDSDGIALVGGRRNSPTTNNAGSAANDNNMYQPNTILMVFTTTAARATAVGTVAANATAYGAIPGGTIATALSGVGATGVVIYTEDNKALIRVSSADPTLVSTTTAINNAQLALDGLAGATGSTVTDTYNNEAGYLSILKKFTGQISTLTGEKLQTGHPEFALSIDKVSVEAMTRRLRTSFTLELAQDLKNIHGKDIATELIEIMEYEVAQSIDRQILDVMDSAAVPSTYNVKSDAVGRWQAEYFRNAYTELVRKSNDIARTTLRGPGNFIVANTDVVTMLEQLPGFAIAPVEGKVDSATVMNNTGSAFVGTMGGRFTIYRDIFQTNKQAIVGFKGKSNYETGIIWSPYIPLELKNTVDPISGNPAIIAIERSGITQVPFASDAYYRRVTFSGLFY